MRKSFMMIKQYFMIYHIISVFDLTVSKKALPSTTLHLYLLASSLHFFSLNGLITQSSCFWKKILKFVVYFSILLSLSTFWVKKYQLNDDSYCYFGIH